MSELSSFTAVKHATLCLLVPENVRNEVGAGPPQKGTCTTQVQTGRSRRYRLSRSGQGAVEGCLDLCFTGTRRNQGGDGVPVRHASWPEGAHMCQL